MKLEIDLSEATELEYDRELLSETVRVSAEAALEDRGISAPSELSVTVTDNDGIRRINRDFRGIDRPTDVLSFPMYAFTEEDMPPEDGTPLVLGDMVLSVERAAEQAKEYGHSLRREIAFLTVHSVLHLLGYDHEISAEAESEMFVLQEKILDGIGITRES